MSEFIDLSVIGLERIYNGEEKLINLINPKNLNVNIEYLDKESNIIKAPIEVGEYTVVVKNEDIKITKKLVIKKKEDIMSKFHLSDSEIQNLVIDAESIIEEFKEETIIESNIEKKVSNKRNLNKVLLRLL